MRYFNYLTAEQEQEIFFLPPQSITVDNQALLEYALGATLYMPATRKTAAQDIVEGKLRGLMSMVWCLEDAIGDNEVELAEKLIGHHFGQLTLAISQDIISLTDVPLIFVRVRDVEQMRRIMKQLGQKSSLLTGFVFPKFTATNGFAYFEALAEMNSYQIKPIYGMPILESTDIMYVESRQQNLLAIKKLLDSYRELVLNVRIGATDFCGSFGLRRRPDMTIYDISMIRSCIDDILNIFTRLDHSYVVSGPVWEFYSSERVLKPLLHHGPFTDNLGQAGERMRGALLNRYMDGFIHEVILDKANGLIGKTVIHPSHIKTVQALAVVTHEEYMDACSILAGSEKNAGVIASQYANKMNEIKPHMRWAQKIMIKSKIYGVFHEQHNFTSLLT